MQLGRLFLGPSDGSLCSLRFNSSHLLPNDPLTQLLNPITRRQIPLIQLHNHIPQHPHPYPHLRPLPSRNPHPNPCHRVLSQIRNPLIHRIRIRIPRLDHPLMHRPLIILLRRLVHERTLQHRPYRSLRRQIDGFRKRDPECAAGVRCEMDEQLEEFGLV